MGLNWTWILTRTVVLLVLLALLFLSQRFWYRGIWRVTSNWGRMWLRVGVRIIYLSGWVAILLGLADALRQDHGRILPSHSPVAAFTGLWFASALAGYLAIQGVHAVEWVWHRVHHKRVAAQASTPNALATRPRPATRTEFVPDPSRRTFFRTASVVAGAAPFLGVMYGYASERLRYEVRRVEIPISNLPPPDGRPDHRPDQRHSLERLYDARIGPSRG